MSDPAFLQASQLYDYKNNPDASLDHQNFLSLFMNTWKQLTTLVAFFCLASFALASCLDTCPLNPEVTEGPYYVDLQLVRSDIRYV